MKSITCDICKRRVEMSVELLVAAMSTGATTRCLCGSQIEAVYIDHQLVTANVPRMLTFSAPITFSNSTGLEAR